MSGAKRCFVTAVLLVALILLALPISASANSAPLPGLVVIVVSPPDDLRVAVKNNERVKDSYIMRKAWEGYYSFYNIGLRSDGDYRLIVSSGEDCFECKIEALNYNSVYTLDMSNRQLSPGAYPFRELLIALIRIVLTLLLEGVLFWLFLFRQRRSWYVFFIVNLITQTGLSIWLSGSGPITPSYFIFSVIIAELLVFLAEIVAYPILIKEHEAGYTMAYAAVANLFSLIAGCLIISYLPV